MIAKAVGTSTPISTAEGSDQAAGERAEDDVPVTGQQLGDQQRDRPVVSQGARLWRPRHMPIKRAVKKLGNSTSMPVALGSPMALAKTDT